MTAFLFWLFLHHMQFDVRDNRRGISVVKEKVAFSLCYSNSVLLGAKFSYLGLPSTCQNG
ncbi:hypothetical protein NEUTE1DRAFT_48113 [Neurospora tetrasperma FGSC 2508]|uniref:Uncharacterized protein n=1 Tax=Neurospora tetrasperma (strain FGSC 2508 / ATCC MYA-4615 / P0657) TaxID=510951 RepID=F8MU30_NEUT8|nr:uncharacterized protein NEUTE1DRAFT_48113 [Neurospora tetrasperma FGSC 2508]EGO55512.1 hypothetical protein NEUTE1DRAFT_48113 [Neurospora tetrasperma FGSC 2508]EGZ69249.1 hypothetical protein NEUTE2DRAFT_131660 [Neurospora tetrasperma FGSC 2509]